MKLPFLETAAFYALDIETDTEGGPNHGLDPRLGGITTVALTVEAGRVKVFDLDSEGSEEGILNALDQTLEALAPGIIVTWNGSVFDFPFIAARASRLGLTLPLKMEFSSLIPVKYQPVPGFLGGYKVAWGAHAHVDVQTAYRAQAEAEGIPWSLKPIGRANGFDPIEVDRAKMHLLTRNEERAYAGSDVSLTRNLALEARAKGILPAIDQF